MIMIKLRVTDDRGQKHQFTFPNFQNIFVYLLIWNFNLRSPPFSRRLKASHVGDILGVWRVITSSGGSGVKRQ